MELNPNLALEIIKTSLLAIKPRGLETIDEKTPLWTARGNLDSIQLVQFIVELESQLKEKTGKSFSLLSDSALSSSRSPFSTVESLKEFILKTAES